MYADMFCTINGAGREHTPTQPKGHLDSILAIDTEKMTVTVEPMVTVGQATKVLNPLGWTLACTLEIMDATIGGLCIAVGMTTHSHRVGLIQETVLWYDVVVASGEVVRASPTENKELYYALPWSHGTLGFVVALELKLVRSKPYIKLEYLPFSSMEAYCKEIRQLSCTDKDPPDFVEARRRSTRAAPREGRSTKVTLRGLFHGLVVDLFYTDVRSLLMVL